MKFGFSVFPFESFSCPPSIFKEKHVSGEGKIETQKWLALTSKEQYSQTRIHMLHAAKKSFFWLFCLEFGIWIVSGQRDETETKVDVRAMRKGAELSR